MRAGSAGIGTALVLAAALAALAQPARIELRGEDQHDRDIEVERYSDRPLLLLWGDRKGSGFMLAWNRALAAQPGTPAAADTGLARLDVAHVRGAPFFVKGRIKKRFRRDWDSPVMMDWKGRLQETYACVGDSCTVLLFDRDGRLQRRWTVGAVSDSVLAEIRDAAAGLSLSGS